MEDKGEVIRAIVLDGESLRLEEHVHILGIENDTEDIAMVLCISDQAAKYKNMHNSIGIILDTKEDALHLAALITNAAEEIFRTEDDLRH